MKITASQLAKLDADIAHDRSMYLKAIWAGHDGEAETYEIEVDRLLDLRHTLAAKRDKAH